MKQSYHSVLSTRWAGLLLAALISMLMAGCGASPATSQLTRPDAGTATRHDAGQTDSGPALLAWSQSCLAQLQNAYGQARIVDSQAAKPTLLTATDERYKNYPDIKRIPGQEAGIAWGSNGKGYQRLIAEIEIRDRDDLYENIPNNWVPVHLQSEAIFERGPESPREYFDENVKQHQLTGPGPVEKGDYNAYRRNNNAVAHILVVGLTNPDQAARLVDIFEPVLDTCLREGHSLNIKPRRTAPPEPPHTQPIWREPPLEIRLRTDGMPQDAKLHIEILSNRRYLDYRPNFDSDIDLKSKSKHVNNHDYRILYRGPKWTCDIAWPFRDSHQCLRPKRWLFFPVAYLNEERKPINECQLRATLTGTGLKKTVIHNFYVERHEHKIDISLNLEQSDVHIPVQIERWISPPKSILFESMPQWPASDGPVYRVTNNSHSTLYTTNTGTLEQWQDGRWQTAYNKTRFRHPMDFSGQVRPMDWDYFAPILIENRPKPLPPGKYRYRLKCYLMPSRMENIDAFELISEFPIHPPAPPAGIIGPADAGGEPRDR